MSMTSRELIEDAVKVFSHKETLLVEFSESEEEAIVGYITNPYTMASYKICLYQVVDGKLEKVELTTVSIGNLENDAEYVAGMIQESFQEIFQVLKAMGHF